jgi:HSP20 family protein
MAEVEVVKQPKQEKTEVRRRPAFETPLFGGSLFSMNPFALMRQLTDEMDRLAGNLPRAAGDGSMWTPAIEVKQKDGKLLVTAELPGLKKENVNVHIDDNLLVVEGERKEEKEEKREGYYRSERSYGKFYRSIALPEGAESDKATAQFNNGILEISVPIPEMKAKSQQVPVQDAPKSAA